MQFKYAIIESSENTNCKFNFVFYLNQNTDYKN